MSGVTDTLPLVPALTSVFAAAVAGGTMAAKFISTTTKSRKKRMAVGDNEVHCKATCTIYVDASICF